MTLTQPIYARALVSEENLARPGYEQGFMATIAQKLLRDIESRAYTAHRESIHVHRGVRKPKSMQVEFVAVWSPRTARFVGGEYDGHEIDVERGNDGLPLDMLRLPYQSGPTNVSAPSVTQHPAYRRVGIEPLDDVWLYEYVR